MEGLFVWVCLWDIVFVWICEYWFWGVVVYSDVIGKGWIYYWVWGFFSCVVFEELFVDGGWDVWSFVVWDICKLFWWLLNSEFGVYLRDMENDVYFILYFLLNVFGRYYVYFGVVKISLM